MESVGLVDLVGNLLEKARSASAGRSAQTVHGGQDHHLRQTVIALAGGRALGEHESPGEATLQVLEGTVRLHAGDETWEGAVGDFVLIPPVRHDLEAVTDAAVLLSVAVHDIP